MGINKVILVGNVGRDVELRSLPSGTHLGKFSLATTDMRSKDEQGNPRTEWHNIVVWGKLAEFCDQYVSKGRQLYVEGSIRTRSYEKDGQKVYTTDVNIGFDGKVIALDIADDEGDTNDDAAPF